MKIGKVLARTGIILFSAVCLTVFQLANSILFAKSNASAQNHFPTLAPNTVTLTPPIEDGTPIPTPIPTIGPGATFEEGDPNLPEIDEDGRVGDDEYGYYQLPEDPSLYLIWTTNENGTHYTVVSADSDILSGGENPDMGFLTLVDQREQLHTNIELARDNRETKRSNATLLRWGTIGLLAGGVVCTIASGGLCGLALIGIAATSFFASTQDDSDAEVYQNSVDSELEQLRTVEGDLRFRQRIAQSTETGG